MNRSIGLIEFKSIPVGMRAADHMVKSGSVELMMSTPVCPGKYIVLLSGDVSAVDHALSVGEEIGGMHLIGSYCISGVDESIFPAIMGSAYPERIESIGVVETISGLSAIMLGDLIVKKSAVELVDIRVAKGLGGKGLVLFTGSLSSVNASLEACLYEMDDKGEIVSHSVIASPDPQIIEAMY